jgi:hypothetical protein
MKDLELHYNLNFSRGPLLRALFQVKVECGEVISQYDSETSTFSESGRFNRDVGVFRSTLCPVQFDWSYTLVATSLQSCAT